MGLDVLSSTEHYQGLIAGTREMCRKWILPTDFNPATFNSCLIHQHVGRKSSTTKVKALDKHLSSFQLSTIRDNAEWSFLHGAFCFVQWRLFLGDSLGNGVATLRVLRIFIALGVSFWRISTCLTLFLSTYCMTDDSGKLVLLCSMQR